MITVAARRSAFLVGLLGALTTLPAHAADDAQRAEARERFDRGLVLFNQGDNLGALAEFQRAYQLTSNATVLYNIARVQAATNDPVAALVTLDQLAADPKDLSAARRQQVEALRQEQQQRVGVVVIATTAPRGTRVEVDGSDAGLLGADKTLRLSAGRHVVGLLAVGFHPQRKTVLVAGQEQKSLDFELEPLAGALGRVRLQVEPYDVAVLLNGQELGKTPNLVEFAVAPGKHQLELKRTGYRAVSREVVVPEAGALEVKETLVFDDASRQGYDGRLSVRASEESAVVFIDGVITSDAQRGVSLPEGAHRLRVERDGFVPSERAIVVPRGSEAVIDVALAPTAAYRADYASAASARRAWALGLGIGGAVLAGASGGFLAWNGGKIDDAQRAFDAAYAEAEPECRPNETAQCKPLSTIAAIREEDLGKQKDRQVFGWVGVGVGAAALGTGVVLWLTGNDPSRYEPKPESDVFGSLQLTPWFAPNGAGFSLGKAL